MKRVFIGGPLDGLEDRMGDAPRAAHEDAVARGVIGTIISIESQVLVGPHGAPMRALYRVAEVYFVDGVMSCATLRHAGWDSVPAGSTP